MARANWIALGLAAGLGLPAAAWAQPGPEPSGAIMATPEGCHWIDRPGRVQELWCRGENGRMRPTTGVRRDLRDPADSGCPRGLMDSGVGCATEARVLAALVPREPLPPSPGPSLWRDEPRAYLHGDGRGGWRGGYMILDGPGGVTVVQPLPRHGH